MTPIQFLQHLKQRCIYAQSQDPLNEQSFGRNQGLSEIGRYINKYLEENK